MHQIKKIESLFFICCLLLVQSLSGQPIATKSLMSRIDSYDKKQWTIENGLPQNTVTDILHSKDGYIWLSTFGGLARFDGTNFKVFNIRNSSNLLSNRITRLLEHSDGSIWMAHEISGVTRYKSGNFEPFSKGTELEGIAVHDIYEDNDQVIWFGTDQGIYKFDCDNVLKKYYHSELIGKSVEKIFQNKDGGIILLVINEQKLVLKQLLIIKDSISIIGNQPMNTVNNYWPKNDKKRQILMREYCVKFKSGLRNMPIQLLKDNEGTLWVGTVNGLFVVPHNTNPSNIFSIDNNTLSNVRIKSLYQDRNNNIWVGTDGDGIYLIKRKKITSLIMPDTSEYQSFNSIVSDGKGGFWASAPCEMLVHYKDGLISNYKFPEGCISALDYDETSEDQFVYVGLSNSLVKFNGYKYSEVTTIGENENYDVTITSILIGENGVIWLGTFNDGVYKFENNILSHELVSDAISGKVQIIVKTRLGDILIGTDDGLLKISKGLVSRIVLTSVLNKVAVRTLHEDSDGIIWVGTYGAGLFRIEGDSITNITKSAGLNENVISRIHEDAHGRFWLQGNKGLSLTTKQSLNDFTRNKIKHFHCVGLGSDEGMKEGNGREYTTTTSDGITWWPTIRGVSGLNADTYLVDSTAQKLIIKAISIENKSQPIEESMIELSAQERDFSVEVAPLNYIAPEKVLYAHKLEGYDEKWIYDEKKNTFNYTNIEPGNYVLKITAANDSGVWSNQIKNIDILINPTLLEIFWVRVLLVAIFIFLVWALFRFRIANIKANEKKLEKLASKISKTNTELINYNSQLEQFSFIVAHNFKAPIARLLGLTNIFNLENAKNSENKMVISKIIESSYELDEIIKDVNLILEVKSSKRNKVENISFTLKVDEIKKILSKQISINNVQINIDFSDIDLINSSALYIHSIFYNLISNAIRYRSDRRKLVLNIKSKEFNSFTQITFEDNGLGIDLEKYRSKIFTLYSRFHEHVQGKGMGLYMVKTQIEALGGSIEVSSIPDEGSTFTVTLKNR